MILLEEAPATKYRVIYDFAEEGFRYQEIIGALVILVIGIVVFSHFKNKKKTHISHGAVRRNVELIFLSLLLIVFTCGAVFIVYSAIKKYSNLNHIYQSKAYQIIEGPVKRFIPQNGRSLGSFSVNGVQFSYSAQEQFRYKLEKDIHIEDGAILRIAYLGETDRKTILKIEIKK